MRSGAPLNTYSHLEGLYGSASVLAATRICPPVANNDCLLAARSPPRVVVGIEDLFEEVALVAVVTELVAGSRPPAGRTGQGGDKRDESAKHRAPRVRRPEMCLLALSAGRPMLFNWGQGPRTV